MVSKHTCIFIQLLKPTMQSHTIPSGTQNQTIPLGIQKHFASVEVVRLGTKRPTLFPGSISLASRPVTRQVYAAGGLPTYEKTHTQQKYNNYKSRT